MGLFKRNKKEETELQNNSIDIEDADESQYDASLFIYIKDAHLKEGDRMPQGFVRFRNIEYLKSFVDKDYLDYRGYWNKILQRIYINEHEYVIVIEPLYVYHEKYNINI